MVKGTYERRLSKRRYLIAFALTTFIFLIGLLVGYAMTNERTSFLEDVAYKQKLDYESLQLQSLYLDLSRDNASCNIFNNILETSLSNVADAQAKVEFYMKESTKASYTELKRDYTLAEIRYWLLNKRTKETCKGEHVAVLYFYSNEECFRCGPQATILNYLKEKFKDKLLVFALDSDFTEEPMIRIISQTYNITSVPSVVIEDKVFDTLVSKDKMIKEICMLYTDKPKICGE